MYIMFICIPSFDVRLFIATPLQWYGSDCKLAPCIACYHRVWPGCPITVETIAVVQRSDHIDRRSPVFKQSNSYDWCLMALFNVKIRAFNHPSAVRCCTIDRAINLHCIQHEWLQTASADHGDYVARQQQQQQTTEERDQQEARLYHCYVHMML